MILTLAEYLKLRVGKVWTEEDSEYVLHHVAEVEKTALAVEAASRTVGAA